MLHTSDFLGPPPASRCRRPFLSTLARPPTRSHPPSRRLRVGAEVRRRVPMQDPTGRTRPRSQGPKTSQRPAALTAVRALRLRYVGAESNIEKKAGPTSEGRPVRTRQNRNVAPPDPPPCPSSQSGAARGPITPPRPVIGHCEGPSITSCARLTPRLTVENRSIHRNGPKGAASPIFAAFCRVHVLDPSSSQCSSEWVKSQIRNSDPQYDLALLEFVSGSHARTLRAPCAHPSRLSGGTQRHPEAPAGTPQEVVWGLIQELHGALLRRFVAARQNDYASHAGTLSYGATVAPRCTSRIENVAVKRTLCIAFSRLPGQRDLVGSGRMGLVLPSDCSPTAPCPSRSSRPHRLAPPAQLEHIRKKAGRSP